MNIKSIAIVSLAAAALCVSCKHDKVKDNDSVYGKYLRPPGVDFKAADTAEVRSLCDAFANALDAKDYDAASKMLYKFYGDSLKPLSEADQRGFVKAYSMRPLYAIKQHSFLLRDSLNNEVTYRLQIIKNGDINTDQGVTSLSLNPIIHNGKWCLTLLDVYAKGVNTKPYEKKH